MEYDVTIENDTGFEITDDAVAEWALKKVLDAKKEQDRLMELVNAERERLDLKQSEIESRYENETAFLLSKLNLYLNSVETKKTKTQETYRLLSGKLVRKFAKQKLKPNKETLLEWCKENAPDCIKHTEEVMWSEVKGKFNIIGDTVIYTETGECVTCVGVEETPATFDVTGE